MSESDAPHFESDPDPETQPEAVPEGSEIEAEKPAVKKLEWEASKPDGRVRSSTSTTSTSNDTRRRRRKPRKPATTEGSDPPLFPRGAMLIPWLLLVLIMPIFVGIAGDIYADSLVQKERAKRQALEKKRQAKMQVAEQTKSDAKAAYDRGRRHRENGDHTEAIEEFTVYLTQYPTHVEAHWMRGLSRFRLQDPAGAREDFDAVIRSRPNHSAALRSRGQARALLGDRLGGIEDIERALELRPDTYQAIWIAGLGGATDPLRPFANGTGWISDVARYFLDRMTEEELLARAGQARAEEERLNQLCEAHGYIGLRAERDGDKAKAMDHYRRCVDTRVTNFIEYRWAIIRLNQEAQGNVAGPFDLERD